MTTSNLPLEPPTGTYRRTLAILELVERRPHTHPYITHTSPNVEMYGESGPFTDPFTAATATPRSFHVVGNASETVCKGADSMYIYGRSQLGPYTLHV